MTADPAFGESLLLFIKCELEGRKWQISEDCRLVARVERTEAFGPRDRLYGVPSGAVIISRIEEGVVVASLKLQTSFEDFGGHVDDGGSKVCNKT